MFVPKYHQNQKNKQKREGIKMSSIKNNIICTEMVVQNQSRHA